MSWKRRWAALAVLCLPVLLISIDSSVLNIAVPSISTHLHTTSQELLWIIDIYSFLLAGLLVLMGSLSDRYGRRLLLLIGAPMFALASLAAAFATSPELLIAARAVLGVGGATLMPATLGLIRAIFHDAGERRLAVAVWGASFSGGSALGPALGGVLLEHYWWGSVFLINVPVMLLFLATALFLLPESKDPNPGPFDVPSALLSLAGLLPLVYALKTLVKDPHWTAVAALAVGAFFLTVFIQRQRRIDHPMLDLDLFRRPGFSPAIGINVLTVFAMLGFMFFLPQYLMLVQGRGTAQVGILLLPLALSTVAGAMLAPALARKVPVRTVVTTGLLTSTLGTLLVTRFTPTSSILFVMGATVMLGFGIGLAQTMTSDMVLTTAPPGRAGAASAISETGYEFGAAMGMAVLGTIGLAIYGAGLRPVGGMTATDLQVARETLGEAHEVAARIGGSAGEAFHQLASASFVHSMDVVAYLCAAAMLTAAALAWFGMRTPHIDAQIPPARIDEAELVAVS